MGIAVCRTLPSTISELKEAAPHSVAMSYRDQLLTYQQLDLKAEMLAGYLSQLGVGPGGIVALCMERSFDWIIAALAIMRAGAAYVPCDSAWPDARVRFVLGDSGATVLVARAATLERLKI